MAAYVAIAVLALTLPPLALLVLARRMDIPAGRFLAWFGLGASGWMLAKIPKAAVVLPLFLVKGLPLQMDAGRFEELLRTDASILLAGSLAAAVFEELSKPLGLLLLRRSISPSSAALAGWVAGVGAGVLEALTVLAGDAYRIAVLHHATFASSVHVPIERCFIVAFHGALTAFLVSYVSRRRYLIGVLVPIGLHALINVVFTYLQVHRLLSLWAIEVLIAVFVMSTVAVVVAATSIGESARQS